MWHAFDIIADAMQVEPGLREANPRGMHKLVYRELLVRWFKDKSGKGQWPAVVDERPGISFEMVPASETNSNNTLNIEHARIQGTPVRLNLKLVHANDGWRTPIAWNLTEKLGDNQFKSELQDTTEQGLWDGKQVTRSITGSANRVIKHTYATSQPACYYALLASFPLNEIAILTNCDALFTEGMQQMGQAAFVKGAMGNAAEHDLAKGLTCYKLNPSMGFPLEFWVNEHGMVVYLVEGATRAWVLQSMEARS